MYIFYPKLLQQHGFGIKYLLSLTGSAGPLYGVIHVIFEPFTHLRPAATRLVSVFSFFAILAITFWTLKKMNYRSAAGLTGAALCIPMSWVVGGMALTEAPSLVFAALSFSLLALSRTGTWQSRNARLLLLLGSAFCLGLASTGRQPFVLLSIVPLGAALFRRESIWPPLGFFVVSWLPVLPLFLVWKSLVPPIDQYVLTPEAPIAPFYGLFSMGYAAICVAIVAPSFLRAALWPFMILATLALGLNFAFGPVSILPLTSLVRNTLPEPFLSAYGTICGSLFMCAGLCLLGSLAYHGWSQRKDYVTLVASLSFLVVALSPLFITSQFSSRYTEASLPFLLFAVRNWYRATLSGLAIGIAGGLLGALCLWGYYAAA